jgi:hypothetical protein
LKNKFILGFFVLTALFLLSCKAHVSLSGASIPAEAQTASVALFKNNSSIGPPTLPQDFTEKLRNLILQQTRLAVIARNGDMNFDGYISDYNVAPVAANGDQASQNRLTITVHVVFTNKFDPTKNFEKDFPRFADFGATESITAKGPELVQEIFRQITEDVYYASFNNW